jgi:hypothetical protein
MISFLKKPFFLIAYAVTFGFSQETLTEKALRLEQILQNEHIREGQLVPTIIQVVDGPEEYDAATQEDFCFNTGRYVAAECFRFATTGEEQAKSNAQRSMHALLKLEKVTGTPGVVARAYKKSSKPTIDEQAFFFPHEWHQSTVFPDYRWLGDLSVDQLNGWMIGLATYYDFIADKIEKNQISNAVDRVMSRIFENDMRIVDVDGKMTLWGNLSPTIPHESLNALLSLSNLKIAYHITHDNKYNIKYNELVNEFKFHEEAALAKIVSPQYAINRGDDGLAIDALRMLHKYEKDPVILEHYHSSLERHWILLNDENHAEYDFIRQALYPETQSIDQNTLNDLTNYEIKKMKRITFMRSESGSIRLEAYWQTSPRKFLWTFWYGRYHGFINEDGTLNKPAITEKKMVFVSAGKFIMGSDVGDMDERPQREVYLSEFWIDKYEVTNSDFKKFESSFTFPEGKEINPALVTWEQANAYARWADKRLPTEEEWEKAARGIDGRIFPWGNYWDVTMTAWDDASPIGKVPAGTSPYGCFDMAGNVWEWTSSWYKSYPGNDIDNSAYGEKYKVIRGGAEFNNRSFFRCAHRYYLPPDSKIVGYKVGFRCVKDEK